MRKFFVNEINRMKDFFLEERLSATILSSSALFLILSRYLPTSPPITGTLLYYMALPLLVIILILRSSPLDFGLRAGLWRIWLPHVAVACALTAILAISAARIPAFREYYGSRHGPVAARAALVMIDLLAVEFMFRGFILFGLKERFGRGAVPYRWCLLRCCIFTSRGSRRPAASSRGFISATSRGAQARCGPYTSSTASPRCPLCCSFDRFRMSPARLHKHPGALQKCEAGVQQLFFAAEQWGTIGTFGEGVLQGVKTQIPLSDKDKRIL